MIVFDVDANHCSNFILIATSCFTAGSVQSAINIADFGREYITFNFKGEGHAQLFFQEDVSKPNEKAFTVSFTSLGPGMVFFCT